MAQVESLRTEHKLKKTEAGEIPVDWEVASLGDISTEIYRYPTYYNIQYVEKGTPEIRGELIKPAGTLETDMSLYRFISKETAAQFPRTRMQEGDFVISVRGTMGKVAIVPKELDGANMTANLMRISPDRNRVYLLWLHQVFMSDRFQEQLSKASSSTTIKTIKAPELKSLMFAIPSFPEQKKIAEILLTVDSAIEKTTQLIEKKKELKKGLMQELLTRGIGHKEFMKTKLGEIPVEWKVTIIGKVAETSSGGTPSRNIEGYFKGTIPWVKSGELEDNLIYDTEERITESGLQSSSAKLFPKGTLLIALYGATVGKTGILGIDATTNQAICAILCKENSVIAKFLQYYLILKRDQLVAMSSGAAQPNISQEIIQSFSIFLPPKAEQKEIVEILSSVDAEIEQEVSKKERIEQLKKGLMQVLLTGKVRVRI